MVSLMDSCHIYLWQYVVYLLQVEMVYSLLSMLGTHDKDDMSRTLLAMSSSQDSCIAMRQSGRQNALTLPLYNCVRAVLVIP